MTTGWRSVCTLAFVATLTSAAPAQQPADYVLVGSGDYAGGSLSLTMFDRRLELVNQLEDSSGGTVATAADHSRWVTGNLSGALLHLDA
jgi:hypothetical protein